MPIDYSGGTLKEFGPKVGESKVIHIRESVKVEDPTGVSEENFRSQTRNWGYRFELTLTNGRIFQLNVWKLFFAFKEPINAELDGAGVKIPVQDGDKINIDHPANSVYTVTIIEKGTGIGVEVEDTEKLEYQKNKENTGTGQAPAQTAAPVNTATPPAQTVQPATQVAPNTVTPPVEKVKKDTPAEGEPDLPF